MQNKLEVLVGAVALVCAVLFSAFVYRHAAISAQIQNYQLRASFAQVDGISIGSDVRMSGVKVGTVSSMKLDPKTYRVLIFMNLANEIAVPKDSSVQITGGSILGSKYISIDAGGSEEALKPGDEIEQTQSSVNIESLIGKFMLNVGRSSSAS